MCGAVKVTARADAAPVLRACHCAMCRQHNSFAFVNVQTDPASVTISGPEKIFKSSDWAQRAFCETCGSTLWYGLQHDGSRNLSAGLFESLEGSAMLQEYFVDECLYGAGFAGDHQKLTREETFALFAPVEGDAK